VRRGCPVTDNLDGTCARPSRLPSAPFVVPRWRGGTAVIHLSPRVGWPIISGLLPPVPHPHARFHSFDFFPSLFSVWTIHSIESLRRAPCDFHCPSTDKFPFPLPPFPHKPEHVSLSRILSNSRSPVPTPVPASAAASWTQAETRDVSGDTPVRPKKAENKRRTLS
jgi:hypothetical protein